jgi:hypothetical protein
MSAMSYAPAVAPRDRLREAEERILEWAEENTAEIEDAVAEAAAAAGKQYPFTSACPPDLTIRTQQAGALRFLVREWQQEKFRRAGGRS